MTTGYQIKNQAAAYYLTLQVVFWVDIFSRKKYRDIFIESLKYCQKNKELEIFAFVIMSNHVHLLVRSGNEDLSSTLRDLKKFTSKKILSEIENSNEESRRNWLLKMFRFAGRRQNKNGEYQLWTHENHAIEIYSNFFVDSKIEYIHNNPVRAGLVENSWEYLYSSARNYADLDALIDVTVLRPLVSKLK